MCFGGLFFFVELTGILFPHTWNKFRLKLCYFKLAGYAIYYNSAIEFSDKTVSHN